MRTKEEIAKDIAGYKKKVKDAHESFWESEAREKKHLAELNRREKKILFDSIVQECRDGLAEGFKAAYEALSRRPKR